MSNNTDAPNPNNLRHRIESTTKLPAMPDVAQSLLRLNTNPHSNVNDLIEIIELDPSIAAQIMRYARSALYGYRGEIPSLSYAIKVVLGYNPTIDIALGLSLGKTFNIPDNGPMGLYPFWQHSIYSAALVQRLIQIMPRQHQPLQGIGFLCGLLHNFGVLLVAHIFKAESKQLQQAIENNANTPRVDIERQILGTDHMEIGTWLVRNWNLQTEIQVAVAEHHNEHYRGIHAAYAKLTLIADRLLKRHDIGDAESTELPDSILSSLGFTQEQAEEVLNNLIMSTNELDTLAEQFAA
jgi:HD-like signal output (HDOD) protein